MLKSFENSWFLYCFHALGFPGMSLNVSKGHLGHNRGLLGGNQDILELTWAALGTPSSTLRACKEHRQLKGDLKDPKMDSGTPETRISWPFSYGFTTFSPM